MRIQLDLCLRNGFSTATRRNSLPWHHSELGCILIMSLMLKEIVEGHQLKSIDDLASTGIGVFSVFWIAGRKPDDFPES